METNPIMMESMMKTIVQFVIVLILLIVIKRYIGTKEERLKKQSLFTPIGKAIRDEVEQGTFRNALEMAEREYSQSHFVRRNEIRVLMETLIEACSDNNQLYQALEMCYGRKAYDWISGQLIYRLYCMEDPRIQKAVYYDEETGITRYEYQIRYSADWVDRLKEKEEKI